MPSSSGAMRAASLILVLACLAVNGAAASFSNRKLLQANCTFDTQVGKNFLGYTYASDVIGYPEICLDGSDIIAAARASDFTTAKNIFDNGKNARVRNCGFKTLRSWATADNSKEPFWALYSKEFSDLGITYMSTMADQAFAGAPPGDTPAKQAEVVAAVSRSTVPLVYMFHEVDAAAAKVAVSNNNDTTGAPHNLDEAFGIYYGVSACNGALSGLASEAGAAAGTGSAVNDAVLKTFVDMQVAARTNNVANYEAGRKTLIKQIIIAHAQMILNKASRIATEGAAAQVAAWAHYRSIQPLVKGVDATSHSNILAALNIAGTADPDAVSKIKAALAPVYTAQGIVPAELGTFATSPSPSPSPLPSPASAVPSPTPSPKVVPVVKCKLAGCKTCNKKATACLACLPTHKLKNGKCTLKPVACKVANCKSCSLNGKVCKVCKNGKAPRAGKCPAQAKGL